MSSTEDEPKVAFDDSGFSFSFGGLTSGKVAIIFAGTNGYLDAIALGDLRTYEAELFRYLETRAPQVLSGIAEKKQLDDEVKTALVAALKDFTADFTARKGTAA